MISKWTRFRIWSCGALFILVAALVGHRAYKLQIQGSQRLRDLAEDNYLRDIQIPGARGRILDRNGKEFASTAQVQSVFGNPRVLAHVPNAAAQLADALGIDRHRMAQQLESRRYFAWLKRRVTPDEARAVRALNLRGVGFRDEPRRFYPLRSTGATVIGYSGTEGQGLEGIERVYDKHLRGSPMVLQGVRDALGRELLVDGVVDTSTSAGADLLLTLDAYLTMVSESALEKALHEYQAQAGIAVVMDPRTGDVLALANAPTFNPNRPSDANQLGARNRALTDAFEPGSTMKTFTFAAAFDAGGLRPTDMFDCENGRMRVGRYTIRDTHPLGVVSAAEVYQQSSNICTTKIARRIGKEVLHDKLVGFGFGSSTGIGLPERSGLVRPIQRWGEIGFANVAFGQGLTATPLQITAGFSAVAAGGVYRAPRLVQSVTYPDGRTENAVSSGERNSRERRVISQQAAATLIEIMAGVPTPKGTARLAAVPGYRVAGKTGTAQKAGPGGYDPDRWLSSFVGFLPADNPQLVIGIFIDEPKIEHLGGKVAAPVFREIAEAAVKYLNIPPTEPVVAEAEAESELVPAEVAVAVDMRASGTAEIISEGPGSQAFVLTDEEFFPLDPELPEQQQVHLVSVPDLSGLSLTEAVNAMNDVGLQLLPTGSGVAFQQEPRAARQVRRGARVHVSFRPGG